MKLFLRYLWESYGIWARERQERGCYYYLITQSCPLLSYMATGTL